MNERTSRRRSIDEDDKEALLQLPPQAIEAEQSILGSMMLDNRIIEKVAGYLQKKDFYRADHQRIFAAIVELDEQNEPADVVTVSEKLTSEGSYDEVGGLSYLGAIATNTPYTGNFTAYAEIISDRAMQRRIIDAGQDIAKAGFSAGQGGAKELIETAEIILGNAKRGVRDVDDPTPTLGQNVANAVDSIVERAETGNAITGVATGFHGLDKLTSGLQPADLIIVGGRPSMGKTTFAMNLVESAAINQNLPTGVFSLEMPAKAITQRMLSSIGEINATNLRDGNLENEDWKKLTSAATQLENKQIFIEDKAGLTVQELRRKALNMHERSEGGLGMIMVDYLQLMRCDEYPNNRVLQMGEISRGLKALAKELNIPVVVLSQLNRGLEQRPDKRPINSDLRESGSLEQDADVIVFVYRDEVYDPREDNHRKAEFIIGKQRNGPLGTDHVTFIGEHTKFVNTVNEHDLTSERDLSAEPQDNFVDTHMRP